MEKNNLHALSFWRWAGISGGVLFLVFGALYFFNVSAQTEAVEKPSEQNLVNGRLAFTSQISGPTFPDGRVFTSNPDGSGQTVLPIPLLPPPIDPAWSPDGTQLVFANQQPPYDIYKINANGTSRVNLTNTQSQDTNHYHPSWSVNGKIAYQRAAQIWTMNEDGSEQAHFSAITQSQPSDPAWSPDGTKLAFASGFDIWVINADGTDEHRITNTPSVGDSDPAWSPDGSKIVFTSGGNVTTMNSDGTNPVTLRGGVTPAWSPDGTRIAYGAGGINVMNSDGTDPVRIVTNIINFPQCCDTLYGSPAWQPVSQVPNTFNITGRVSYNNLPVVGAKVNLSGTTKAVATTDSVGNYQFSSLPAGGNYTVSPSFVRHYFTPANRSFNNLSANETSSFEVLGVCQSGKCVKNGKIAYAYNGEIYVINPDGSGQFNITNLPGVDTQPNYSPDGYHIVFATGRDGNSEIYRMEEDGVNPVRLTNNSATDNWPYYSPDGTSIVFVSERDGNREIYKMDADGSNQVRLTDNMVEDTHPAYSPDGQKILFATRRLGMMRLFTMNTDGTDPQLIDDPVGFIPNYERPSYSPDGSKIIVTYTPLSAGEFPVTNTMNADGTNRTIFPALGRMGSYSPDGTKVVYSCCQFDVTNTYRVRIANADGTSVKNLHTTGTGYDLPDWQQRLVPRAPFDFDGDGRSDVSVFRPSNGAWYLLRSTAGLWVPLWGISTDVPVPADYDGDLKTDVAVWRPSDGNFYVLNSFDSTVRVENFGLAGDVPTGGDWDGDGKADVAVWRGGAQGVFYYRGSMGNPQGNITSLPWGTTGDKPVSGDYDGDGITDAAIYRNGVWWIRHSSNGQSLAYNFGLPNDKIVPADYDGDGKTDQAVYRDGIWYLLKSKEGFTAFQYGNATDVPAPADFDGDGRADATIYRDGAWWILNSQSGATDVYSWGVATDKPIPSVYVR